MTDPDLSIVDAIIVGGGPRGVATVLRTAARVAADGALRRDWW